MLADRAMWASVALVDHLRNGISLGDVPELYAGRSLAALAWLFRLPLNPYWESRLAGLAGANYSYLLEQAGYTMLELTDLVGEHSRKIEDALADGSFAAIAALPKEIVRLLEAVTGMGVDDWAALPGFCQSLLVEQVRCPSCEYSAVMEKWGAPHQIDDPLQTYSQSVSLVFNCPNCGCEVKYDIVHRDSRRFVAVPWTFRRTVTLLGALILLSFPVGLFVWWLLANYVMPRH